MKLLNTTFTGIDEKTCLTQLEDISHELGHVEWGILYNLTTNSKFGTNRYPSHEWLEKNKYIIQKIQSQSDTSFSLHVCGSSVKTLLNQEPSFLIDMLSIFNRVQINFIYKNKYIILLNELLENYPKINFITQHNNANINLWKELNASNHHVLFDSSGGRGIVNDDWKVPLTGKLCGYAGGLGEDNIIEQLTKIKKVVGSQAFWIDMENKVRTEDYFDLEKCKTILTMVNKHVLVSQNSSLHIK